MKTLTLIFVLGDLFKWIYFSIAFFFIFLMLYKPREHKKKRRLRKEGIWDVDILLFTDPDGIMILGPTTVYPKDKSSPVIFVDKDWNRILRENAPFWAVWLHDPAGHRRVRNAQHVGFINEKWEIKITPAYIYAGPFVDGKSHVKTQSGAKYFIDVDGNPLTPSH